MDPPKALSETIQDAALAPAEKARAVYDHCIELMEKLFENPAAENIAKAASAAGEVADLIVSDDDAAAALLKSISNDSRVSTHSVNVGVHSLLLAKRLYGGSPDHDMRELGAGFFLHDIGKVRVDDEILDKRGLLDDQEMKVMRVHPYQGLKILEETKQPTPECRFIVAQHHEREDGSGYPHRLRGDEIHDYARVCCIADVFDALTSERSYKKSKPPFQALQIMKDEMLGHLHTEIFENFVRLFAQSNAAA